MIELLKDWVKDWNGEVEITDNCIKLYSSKKNVHGTVEAVNDIVEYRITVKKYMTEYASPSFDFMAKWNNNIPMPLRTMVGTVEKETKGMVYMKLHGFGEPEVRCMRCGRLLTNPVSKLYGIGPECMSKLGFVCDIEDVDRIKSNLQEIKWEGWVIKSAIVEKEKV